MRALLPLASIGLALSTYSTNILASGWVKSSGSYYVKLSQASSQVKESQVAALQIEEKEATTGIYAEYGLDLPWVSQLTFYSSYKAILRKEMNEPKDEYLGGSLTDSQIWLKNEIFKLSDYTDFPVMLLVAGSFGLHLPTTPNDYALGNESKRIDEVPAGKSYLLSTTDKGSLGSILGLGVSAFYKGFWLNLSLDRVGDLSDDWVDQKSSIALGVGLPFNSWLQLSHTKLVSEIDSEVLGGASTEPLKDELLQNSIGLGVTVWNGLAVELDYTQNQNVKELWTDWNTVTFGVSYRTL